MFFPRLFLDKSLESVEKIDFSSNLSKSEKDEISLDKLESRTEKKNDDLTRDVIEKGKKDDSVAFESTGNQLISRPEEEVIKPWRVNMKKRDMSADDKIEPEIVEKKPKDEKPWRANMKKSTSVETEEGKY